MKFLQEATDTALNLGFEFAQAKCLFKDGTFLTFNWYFTFIFKAATLPTLLSDCNTVKTDILITVNSKNVEYPTVEGRVCSFIQVPLCSISQISLIFLGRGHELKQPIGYLLVGVYTAPAAGPGDCIMLVLTSGEQCSSRVRAPAQQKWIFSLSTYGINFSYLIHY